MGNAFMSTQEGITHVKDITLGKNAELGNSGTHRRW